MSAALTGRSVLVAGLGVSGSAAARALVRVGARVLAVDTADDASVAERAGVLVTLGAEVRTGLGTLATDLLTGCELVVPSPGMPEASPLLVAAVERGIPVWSEPELAWRLAPVQPRLVAVTGTNGKTSTTELLAACLRAPAAGNIGAPLVDLLAGEEAPPQLVVAELSSFQLRFCASLRPEVAVLLNVAPDHLDWHGTMEAYRAAKARIWQAQGSGDRVVVNRDDPGAAAAGREHPPAGRVARFTLGVPGPGEVGYSDGVLVSRLVEDAPVGIVAVGDMVVRGEHHLANAAAAVAAALCAGASPAGLAPAVAGYEPGPDRLEVVATVDGVTWVNDSKATNPHAAAAALASFGSVVWIAGGLSKGLTFTDLEPVVSERVRVAITIGSAGPELAALTRRLGVDTVEAGELTAAVEVAAAAAGPGDTVLLAPACASMDQFSDYAARGEAFRSAVRALARAREVSRGH